MCGGIFDSKKQTQQQQNSTSTGNTQNNLWNNPNLQGFLQGYNQQYTGAGNFNVAHDPNITGAAAAQSGVAGGLQPAFQTANNVGSEGITTGNIQKFMSPYTQNVVDATARVQNQQNQQGLSALGGNQAARGALGNNTGSAAAYLAGVKPGQDAQIAGLYNQSYTQATDTAAKDASLRLQGAGTAGSLTGAATGANTGWGNLGQLGQAQSNFNALTPYSLQNQGIQGYQGFGNLAGMNTTGSSSGTQNGTTTETPSKWAMGSSILGTLFGLAGGGAVPEYADGGMTPYAIDMRPVVPQLQFAPMDTSSSAKAPTAIGDGGRGGESDGGLFGKIKPYINSATGASSSTIPSSAATGGWSTTTSTPGIFGFAGGGEVGPQSSSMIDKVLHASKALQSFRDGGAAESKPIQSFADGGSPHDYSDTDRASLVSPMTPYGSDNIKTDVGRPYVAVDDAYRPPMAIPAYVGATSRPTASASPPPGIMSNVMDHGLVSGLLRSAGYAPNEAKPSNPAVPQASDFDNRIKRWSNLFLSQGVNPQAAQAQIGVEAERRGQRQQNIDAERIAGELLGTFRDQPTMQAQQLKQAADIATGEVNGRPTLASSQFDRQLAMDQVKIDHMMTPEIVRQLEATGMKRGTPEFQKAAMDILTKGRGDKAETEFDKGIAKASAGDLEKRADAVRNSQSQLQRIDQFEKLTNAPGVRTGKFAEHELEAKKMLQAMGFDVKGIPEGEALRALGNQFALSMRSTAGGEGMPGAMSDADRNFLMATVPGLGNTKGGNNMLIRSMRDTEQYKIKTNTEAQRYIHHNKSNVGLGEYMTAWMKENPMDRIVPGHAETRAAAQKEVGTQDPQARPVMGAETVPNDARKKLEANSSNPKAIADFNAVFNGGKPGLAESILAGAPAKGSLQNPHDGMWSANDGEFYTYNGKVYQHKRSMNPFASDPLATPPVAAQ